MQNLSNNTHSLSASSMPGAACTISFHSEADCYSHVTNVDTGFREVEQFAEATQ